MAKIALKISQLGAGPLAKKLKNSLGKIEEGASTFTGSAALLTLGNTKHQALVDSDTLVESLQTQLAQARQARSQAYDDAASFFTNDLAGYVSTIAKGDAAIILAAGLDVVQPRGPSPEMTKVTGVMLVAGEDDGSAKAMWDSMRRSRTYEVQLSPNPTDPTLWETVDIVTDPELVLTGLPSGQKRWTRVRAINNVNKGPWSDPACCTIP